jgi:hypothetical protein
MYENISENKSVFMQICIYLNYSLFFLDTQYVLWIVYW